MTVTLISDVLTYFTNVPIISCNTSLVPTSIAVGVYDLKCLCKFTEMSCSKNPSHNLCCIILTTVECILSCLEESTSTREPSGNCPECREKVRQYSMRL